MLADIVEVKVLDHYRLVLRFNDGTVGEVDVTEIVPFQGVFTKLKEEKYFSTVFVDPESGTICWDSGADLSPCMLYSYIVNKPK